jgi:hypothetical protein
MGVIKMLKEPELMGFVDEENAEYGNIYNYEGREQLLDDDELSPAEEAFMRGYDEALV